MEKNIFLKSTTPHLQRLSAIKIKSRAQPLVPSLIGHTVKGMPPRKKKMIPPTRPQLPPLPFPIPDLYIGPAGMCLNENFVMILFLHFSSLKHIVFLHIIQYIMHTSDNLFLHQPYFSFSEIKLLVVRNTFVEIV